jgi:hypothetical protein
MDFAAINIITYPGYLVLEGGNIGVKFLQDTSAEGIIWIFIRKKSRPYMTFALTGSCLWEGLPSAGSPDLRQL